MGNGRIIEYEDGSAGYIPAASMSQAFRVKIADVTGFSVTKSRKVLERELNVLGHGTQLASVSVAHGTPELIEKWFRNHPLFGQNVPIAQPAGASGGLSNALIADELRKLADLRSEGILTDDEFAAQKASLLGR
jgi:hypothetical protein